MKKLYFITAILLMGYSVFASGDFFGWACGGVDEQGGVLLATTNGVNWFRQGVGQISTNDLSGVCATGKGSVWTVGETEDDYAAIYYSPDNGLTWTRQGDSVSLPTNKLAKVCECSYKLSIISRFTLHRYRTILGRGGK